MRILLPFALALLALILAGHPLVAQPDPTADPVVVSEHGLAGIHDVRIVVLDEPRFRARFGGDTLELAFLPSDVDPPPARTLTYIDYRYYTTEVVVHSRRENAELMRFLVDYRVDGRVFYSDRAQERVERIPKHGSYLALPSEPVGGTVGTYDGMFSVVFDFALAQGDTLRFGATRPGGRRDTVVRSTQSDVGVHGYRLELSTASIEGGAWTPMPTYGQMRLEVTVDACDGCTETIEFEKAGVRYVFPDVPYFTMSVRNIETYARRRIDRDGVERLDTVHYDYRLPPDPGAQSKADTVPDGTLLPRRMDPGTFGLFAYGWLDADRMSGAQRRSAVQRARFVARFPYRPLGTVGRYYLGARNGFERDAPDAAHTLVFVHQLAANGADIVVDNARMGSYWPQVNSWRVADSIPTRELAPGDRFIIEFSDGTLGLPQPDARVLFAVPQTGPSAVGDESARHSRARVLPNPTTGTTTIALELDAREHVRITIASPDGRTVATLSDATLDAGAHRYRFDATDAPAGIYLYRVQIGASIETGTIVVR